MKEIKAERSHLAGIAVLILYISGLVFVTSFHELWFDETQAWLIARCASYKEMLTEVPHYEGHPPFWHLLLSIFAKNGAPVEFTLKAINIIFSAVAMALLIFRSPFPKTVRYLLPFTYFFFYHYGVYSRPYSVTMIAVFLAAMTYKRRNEHPWRYILSLALLSLTTAYGIMISGGLCIVWTTEILSEMKKEKKLLKLWKDKRFYSLCFILAVAVMLIITIFPADDCYYGGAELELSFIDLFKIKSSYVTMAVIPFESWSGVLMGVNGLKDMPAIILPEVLCGIGLWTAFSAIAAKNGKFLTFFIPYFLVSGFMSFKYVSAHHLGIGALFHVFIFWIIMEQNGEIKLPDIFKKLDIKAASPLFRKIVYVTAGAIWFMPVVYSVVASVNDIHYQSSITAFADTIIENHLEDKKIFVRWKFDYEGNDDEEGINKYLFNVLEMPSPHDTVKENKTYLMSDAAILQPYFSRNIFMNFNVDCPDDLYMHYKYKENSEAVFEKWREKGLPDFIIGYCPIDEVYDEEMLGGVRYLPIQIIEYSFIYKTDSDTAYERFYMREDLFDDYPQFRWIDDQTGNVFKEKSQ